MVGLGSSMKAAMTVSYMLENGGVKGEIYSVREPADSTLDQHSDYMLYLILTGNKKLMV